jgi:hypothetical protein
VPQPPVFAGADGVLDPGVDTVGGVNAGALAAPGAGGGGQVGVTHSDYRHPSWASNKVSWAPG